MIALVEYFRNNDLNLLVSDKEGGLVLINRVSYLKISGYAMDKNFNHLEGFRAKTVNAKTLFL